MLHATVTDKHGQMGDSRQEIATTCHIPLQHDSHTVICSLPFLCLSPRSLFPTPVPILPSLLRPPISRSTPPLCLLLHGLAMRVWWVGGSSNKSFRHGELQHRALTEVSSFRVFVNALLPSLQDNPLRLVRWRDKHEHEPQGRRRRPLLLLPSCGHGCMAVPRHQMVKWKRCAPCKAGTRWFGD